MKALSQLFRRDGPTALALLVLLTAIVFTPGRLYSQTAANTGQILGQILDPSGAVIPNAEIRIRNINTNLTRVVYSDETGRYVVPFVPRGPYEVTASSSGFGTAMQQVFITLGSSIAANFTLSADAVRQTIDVTADPIYMEATAASAKSILTDLQIHNLPSNGRQIENLLVQTPGSLIEPMCAGFSISGQKGIYSNINVDGADYNSTFGCGLRGRGEAAPAFSMEALSEFHVVRNVFSSEFGRSTGGLVNMSTKSGTNNWHGSGYFYGRNRTLSAVDPFGQDALAQISQFGGSLGGPIVQDQTFWFFAPEMQQASKPVQVLYSALDRQNLRGTPGAMALLGAAPEEEITAISDSLSVINRLDHQITDNHALFGRFDYISNASNNNPGRNFQTTGPSIQSITNRAASGQAVLENTNYTAVGQLTSFLSPNHINELRFQWARESRPRSTVGTGPEVTIWHGVQEIGTYGPQASGLGFGNLGFSSADDRTQLVNNFSIVQGGHSMKLGFDFFRVNGNMVFTPGANALYHFNSLESYLAREPLQYQQFVGTGTLDLGMDMLAFYVQDEWRPLPGLTLTPGFRYEAQFNPDYLDPTVPDARFPLATNIPNDTGMFAPRLGIAWDLGNNNRTVLRAGGGLFYGSTHLGLLAQSMLFNGGNPELASRVLVTHLPGLQEAFGLIGHHLPTAPLDQLPTFNASQVADFFGDSIAADLVLKAPN